MIICADDYGLSDDIDDAILEVAGAGRLSAVSCLVLFERCSSKTLARLPPQGGRVDIGLHLCLTDEGLPLSPPPGGKAAAPLFRSFGSLVRRATTGRLMHADIAERIADQYRLFVEKCGRFPDFIDGHLHVHQLPGIREALLEFVAGLPPAHRPYVRNTRMSIGELQKRQLPWLKAASIGVFGKRMHLALTSAGLPTNTGFTGIYGFREWQKYPQYLPKFLDCLQNPNGMLVVHPGKAEPWRHQELLALRGYHFQPGMPNRFQHDAASYSAGVVPRG